MSHDKLKNFVAPYQETFTDLTRHYGYDASACYRINDTQLVLVVGTEVHTHGSWPAAAILNQYYTTNRKASLPIGWVRPIMNDVMKKLWPRGTLFYFPEQDLSTVKLMFAMKPTAGKRVREGDLNGIMEVIAHRIAHWTNSGEVRNFVSEAQLDQHFHRVNQEIQMLLDHELRTPLSSVMGYAEMLREYLKDPDSIENIQELQKYLDVVSLESRRALNTLTKLSLSIKSGVNPLEDNEVAEMIDLKPLITDLIQPLQENGKEVLDISYGPDIKVTFVAPDEQDCQIRGMEPLLRIAIKEVLENAAIHAENGRVDATLYRSDNLVLLDIKDDGTGVSPGAENLIFLRFFQDESKKSARRSKRGLGVGLYLSRFITEQHFGQLTYVRTSNRGGLFRFIWPAADVTMQKTEPLSKEA